MAGGPGYLEGKAGSQIVGCLYTESKIVQERWREKDYKAYEERRIPDLTDAYRAFYGHEWGR